MFFSGVFLKNVLHNEVFSLTYKFNYLFELLNLNSSKQQPEALISRKKKWNMLLSYTRMTKQLDQPTYVHAETLKRIAKLHLRVLNLLTGLLFFIYSAGSIPNVWLESTFINFTKKLNATQCKVFVRVIHTRIYTRCGEYWMSSHSVVEIWNSMYLSVSATREKPLTFTSKTYPDPPYHRCWWGSPSHHRRAKLQSNCWNQGWEWVIKGTGNTKRSETGLRSILITV